MAGNVLNITDASFQKDVLESDQPVLVDFWAPWCMPCKLIAPTIDAIATEYAGRARVGKINIDDNPKVASELGVSGIPALMIFKGGQLTQSLRGLQDKAKIASALDANLG